MSDSKAPGLIAKALEFSSQNRHRIVALIREVGGWMNIIKKCLSLLRCTEITDILYNYFKHTLGLFMHAPSLFLWAMSPFHGCLSIITPNDILNVFFHLKGMRMT